MATAFTINWIVLRHLAATLAIVMIIASLPSIGVIVVPDQSGPSLTMDICHPLQSVDRSSAVTLLARSASPLIQHDDVSRETISPDILLLKSEVVLIPDSPPPRSS
jgi:hypothetical protein